MRRITYAEIRAAMADEPFTAEFVGDDAAAVVAAVNQAIDAHLEACFIEGVDEYEWGERKIVHVPFLRCKISPKSLPVLLRRLNEVEDDEGLAEGLCHDILDSIGIEGEGECEIISPVDEETVDES